MIDSKRDELIALGLQWLEHAPPAPKKPEGNGDWLIGWQGEIKVCYSCAERLRLRGCPFNKLAGKPVWHDEWPVTDCFRCDLCESCVQ